MTKAPGTVTGRPLPSERDTYDVDEEISATVSRKRRRRPLTDSNGEELQWIKSRLAARTAT